MNETKINLLDIIDIEFLQKFQDFFAKTMGVASITVDNNGPITKPSNFTDFCMKYTRGSNEGYKRCNDCDITWGKIAAKNGEPVIYNCHSGLTDFAVPIIINGEHIASILAGQVLTKEPDLEHFRAYARELGINEDEYIEAIKKIKIVSEEHVRAAADFSYLVANTISKIGHKNLELAKKNEREKLLRNVMEKIRSSLDIEETLYFICEETAKLFNVQRTAISEFTDSSNYEIFKTRKEYIKNPMNPGFNSSQYAAKTASFWGNALLANNQIIAIDDILDSDTPYYFKTTYKSLGVKSIIGTPLRKGDKVWGTLILSEYENQRHWSEDEKSLLKTIADQVFIAIQQAELYQKQKNAAESEKFNRKILEILRTSLDKETIKNLFVRNIGQYFNADRVFFADYDSKNNTFLKISKLSEYLSNNNEKSFVGYDWSKPEAEEYIHPLLEKREEIIYCLDEYLSQNKKSPEFISLFKDSDVKSSYNLPVLYEDKILGFFCIEYTKNKGNRLSDEDITRIRNLCTQAGIALYHAELLRIEKETADFKADFAKFIMKGTREILDSINNLQKEMENTYPVCTNHAKNLCKIEEIVKKILDFTSKIDSKIQT